MSDSRLHILFSANAEGNGHISRAQVLVPALQKAGAKVDCLFSGRDREKLYNMQAFGDFEVRKGLNMHLGDDGSVSWLRTVFRNSARRVIRDIRTMDLRKYDFVVTDYEPLVSWAARQQGVMNIGVANHYAFKYKVPRGKGHSALVNAGMQAFAPADLAIGMHWHHFNQPVLPPVFEPPLAKDEKNPKKIVVYLNFEKLENVTAMLKGFGDWDFRVYHPDIRQPSAMGNIRLNPPSAQFKHDMADCTGLIGNGGFATKTEALYLGVRMLVKPQNGQPEQSSNARALEKLGWGTTMYKLDRKTVGDWLDGPPGMKIAYPDTATALGDWIVNGDRADLNGLVRKLWAQVPQVGAPKL